MVKIYLTYSESEHTGNSERIWDFTTFLESLRSDGEKRAKIVTQIKNADAVVYLYSEGTEKKKARNVLKDIKKAKKLNLNVIICPLDKSIKVDVPNWVRKADNAARPFTWDELKEKIIQHDAKKYRIFKDSANNRSLNPDFTKEPLEIDPLMLEQYKIYKQEIEHQENARQMAFSAFVTLNSGFLALLGVILDKEHPFLMQNGLSFAIMGILGLLFCNSWSSTLNYYNQILTAKQRVVNHLEKCVLPLLLNATEYYDVMQGPFNKRYKKQKFEELQGRFCLVWTGCLIAALLFFLGWLSLHFSEISDIIIKKLQHFIYKFTNIL